jgi:hypothetical protein
VRVPFLGGPADGRLLETPYLSRGEVREWRVPVVVPVTMLEPGEVPEALEVPYETVKYRCCEVWSGLTGRRMKVLVRDADRPVVADLLLEYLMGVFAGME